MADDDPSIITHSRLIDGDGAIWKTVGLATIRGATRAIWTRPTTKTRTSTTTMTKEAALQAELAKIRSERAAAKAKEEAEADEEEQAQMEEAALTGIPLLNSGSASSSTRRLKRRWNNDVAFRNQARGEPDQNKREEEEVDTAAAASASVQEEADEVADDDPSIITHSRLIDSATPSTMPCARHVRRAVQMGRDQLLLSEDGEKAEGEGRMKLLKQTADVDEEEIRAKYDDQVCFVRSMKHTRRVRMKGVQSHWFDRF